MTQPSLFDSPAAPPPIDGAWTELEHTNGRRYRWRLDTVRSYAVSLEEYVDRAPGEWRWELQVWTQESWRTVRLATRRDEVWAAVRGGLAG